MRTPNPLKRKLIASYVSAPPASIDQTVSDFDGVTFHISTPETKTQILLSIQIRCFPDLVKYGAEEVLQREYGDYVAPVEPGFDFSVLVDLENLPESKGRAANVTQTVESSMLIVDQRNVMRWPSSSLS